MGRTEVVGVARDDHPQVRLLVVLGYVLPGEHLELGRGERVNGAAEERSGEVLCGKVSFLSGLRMSATVALTFAGKALQVPSKHNGNKKSATHPETTWLRSSCQLATISASHCLVYRLVRPVLIR